MATPASKRDRAKPGPKPRDRSGRYDLRVPAPLAEMVDAAAKRDGATATVWLTRAALHYLAFTRDLAPVEPDRPILPPE